MNKQPEALRLAQASEELAADEALMHCWPWPSLAKLYIDDAAELRRQHALIAELVEALEAIHQASSSAYIRRTCREIISKAKEQP